MISVIIPVYNAKEYLHKCLRSVVEQTLKDFEIILIDDGSTDGSLMIEKQYAQNDLRIKIIEQQNQGPAQARNRGIDAATGEYIAFIDADDWVHPNMLQEYQKAIDTSDADLVICGFEYYLHGMRKSVSQNIEPGVYTGFKAKAMAYDMVAAYESQRLRPFSVVRMVKKEILWKKEIRFDEKLKRSEDYLFWVQVHFEVACVCAITDKILYIYNQVPSSISHSYQKGYEKDILYIERCLRSNLKEQNPELDKRIKWFLLYRTQIVIANEAMSEKTWKEKKRTVAVFLNEPIVKEAIRSISPVEGRKLIGVFYYLIRMGLSELYLFLLCKKIKKG